MAASIKKKSLTRTFVFGSLMSLILNTSVANAHGEATAGPHGGFIQMPGAFHTEVVPLGPNKIQVFLLDINFENPSTKDSALAVTHKAGTSTIAKCEVKENSYICYLTKEIDLSKHGLLLITAQRENKKGRKIAYALPLKH